MIFGPALCDCPPCLAHAEYIKMLLWEARMKERAKLLEGRDTAIPLPTPPRVMSSK